MIGVPLLLLGILLVLGAFGPRDAERERGTVTRFVRSPLHPATWLATGAIVAGFVVGLFAFSLIIGLLSAGISTLFIGVGVALVAVAIEGARVVARVERARAVRADPRPLIPHAYRPLGPGPREFLTGMFLDPSRWRDLGYVFIAFPLAVLEFTAIAILWTAVLALLSVPVFVLLTGDPLGGLTSSPGGIEIRGLSLGALTNRIPELSPAFVGIASLVAGLVLLPVASFTAQGLMALHRQVIAGLLCASETRALEQRVETLEESRKALVDVEASELRRIERDLHDGAQQRLVMLTIQLGLAADKIDADPEAAKGLVQEAQDQARQALAEIRDLVRGIAPSILMDRGLVPALAALAGRSPVPTVVLSSLPPEERLSDAVERAAYFVVAEALVNVAKHSGATRCEVHVRREGPLLVTEVRDDGRGGARQAPTGGLAGLAGRVEAVDGRLVVTSPEGGPTVVRAEIPAAAGAPAPAGTPPVTGWQLPGQAPYDPR
ncbi:MAG TPA: sensor histidine kinase [Candidatus Limnocylindrales bacterium]|nr:sensor histidine kinase [Candidatus Limnocylindrales bacterium]